MAQPPSSIRLESLPNPFFYEIAKAQLNALESAGSQCLQACLSDMNPYRTHVQWVPRVTAIAAPGPEPSMSCLAVASIDSELMSLPLESGQR